MEEMGLMGTRTGWLALLLTAGVALAPTGVRGQGDEVPPADPVIPLPLYHDRPERGGFFVDGEFVFFRQTNPIKHQEIALRGLLDFDGSITADLNGRPLNPPNMPPVIVPGVGTPGTFIGSGKPALFADDVSGGNHESYEPGFRLGLGWRFADGTALEFTWMSIFEARYSAVATLVPPGLNPGPLLADTFLFSPVFNFPNDFAGMPQKLALGNPNAAYGIWNAASVMSLDFIQRFDQYDLDVRTPFFQSDCCRCYGLVGLRHTYMWERFLWRTVSEDFNGNSSAADAADFINITSNQLYGPDFGGGLEYYLGHGFSLAFEGRFAPMIDFVREIDKYQREDFAIGHKRNMRDYEFVPELQGRVDLWWYPIEGVQVRVSYEIMAFFDTIASPDPVSFDYSALNPPWRLQNRYFDGFSAGIGFIF
jgi:hypothetical protein